ncbi:hypothetical protein DLH72_02460 [Candidatus Gracilibacteria bacterium]|nr:MAG: hypothetical protein DLH72_02460 [Candidatus Gracilibacteria bacterium]
MKKNNYKFSSLKQIIDIFDGEQIFGATEISEKIGKSKVLIHKYLKELVSQNILEKVGKGAHTKYKKVNFEGNTDKKIVGQGENISKNEKNIFLNYKERKILEENFYKFSPIGEIFKGFSGMRSWCEERKLDLEKSVKRFLEVSYLLEQNFDDCGLIDATKIFSRNMEKNIFQKIFYADQYNYLEFGRGKLAEIAFYAKTTQNKDLIKQTFEILLPKLECLLQKEKFDAIGVIPWSIERKNQILGMLKKELKVFDLPFINIIKYYKNNIAISQKSLKTREQRLQNAKNTIFIYDQNIGKYKKVLLIDDFVGSGATLSETALKLKNMGVSEIFGFSFVGNIDLSYEVINEI